MNRRGSVILHVLVTGTIVALIAACMLRVSFMNYLQTARTNTETSQKRSDEGALSRLSGVWSASNTSCASGAGYTCSGSGACSFANQASCTCTTATAGDPPSITGTWIWMNSPTNTEGACQLSITSTDPMPAQL